MGESKLYHDGSRRLQDRFQTRRLADRLEEVVAHDVFTDADRAFIESRSMLAASSSTRTSGCSSSTSRAPGACG